MGRRSKTAQARKREKYKLLTEMWRVKIETATDSFSTDSRDNHISKDRDLVGDEEG
jgi:hypothetical protein